MEPTIVTTNGSQKVEHQTINGKYRVVFEKAASANKIDGFKIEVNGDSLADVCYESRTLYSWAISEVELRKPAAAPTTAK